MKIIHSINQLYENQYPINELLQIKVDRLIAGIKEPRWHYESRLKSPESFALKLETGRVKDPVHMDDFFACTIVVENANQIKNALEKIKSHFILKDRKPARFDHTQKESSSFVFDDLRVYCYLKNTESRPKGPIDETLFEIQIKTFLQHAWTIATHDLIYKSDDINWSKERIAFQIKAMLEQAELAISGVNNLITLPEVAKDNKSTIELKKVLGFYQTFFSKEELPKDLIRLCKNTNELINNVRLSVKDLHEIMAAETALGRGTQLKNLSPYFLILQSICAQRPAVISEFNTKSSKFKIVVPSEMDCGNLILDEQQNVLYIP